MFITNSFGMLNHLTSSWISLWKENPISFIKPGAINGFAVADFLLAKFNLLKILWHHPTANSAVPLFFFKRVLSLARTIPVAKPTTVWKLITAPASRMLRIIFNTFSSISAGSIVLFLLFPCLRALVFHRQTLLGTVTFQKAPKCRFWYSIISFPPAVGHVFQPIRQLRNGNDHHIWNTLGSGIPELKKRVTHYDLIKPR